MTSGMLDQLFVKLISSKGKMDGVKATTQIKLW